MAKRKPSPCDCPVEMGFYWATNRKYAWRRIVHVARNGHKHVRVYAGSRFCSSFGIEEFADYYGPLEDPWPLKVKHDDGGSSTPRTAV